MSEPSRPSTKRAVQWTARHHRAPGWVRPVQLVAEGSSSTHKAGVLSTFGTLLQGLVRLLTSVAVGRIGGPAALGAFTTAFSTAQLIVLLGPSSIGSAGSKFIARSRGSNNPTQAAAVAAHLAKRAIQSGFTLTIATAVAWDAIHHAGLADALAIATLVLGLCGYSFTRGLQYGANLLPRATAWDIVTAFIGVIGVILALLLGLRGPTVLTPLGIAYCIYGIAGWPWGAKGVLETALRREIDGFIAIAILGTLSSAGFLQASVIVARLSGGIDNAGQYAAALALATPPSLLAASLSLVLFPKMSEAWGRGDTTGLKRQTSSALTFLVASMIGLFGFLVLISGLLVQLIWGQSFEPAANILPVLLLAVMMTTIGVACTNSLTTRSQRGMVMSAVSSLIGMSIGALSWLALGPAFGVIGIALGYLLGTTLIMVIPIAIVWRRDHHHWGVLTLKATSGVALFVCMLLVEHVAGVRSWWQLLFATVFLLSWSVIMYRTVKQASAGVSASHATSSAPNWRSK